MSSVHFLKSIKVYTHSRLYHLLINLGYLTLLVYVGAYLNDDDDIMITIFAVFKSS